MVWWWLFFSRENIVFYGILAISFVSGLFLSSFLLYNFVGPRYDRFATLGGLVGVGIAMMLLQNYLEEPMKENQRQQQEQQEQAWQHFDTDKCASCGKDLAEDERYCMNCGFDMSKYRN